MKWRAPLSATLPELSNAIKDFDWDKEAIMPRAVSALRSALSSVFGSAQPRFPSGPPGRKQRLVGYHKPPPLRRASFHPNPVATASWRFHLRHRPPQPLPEHITSAAERNPELALSRQHHEGQTRQRSRRDSSFDPRGLRIERIQRRDACDTEDRP